jgi:hypothetical protein
MADKVALMSGLEDHQHLLADEQVTGSMQRQAALLLGRLGGDEPHVRSGDRFTDRLGISASFLFRFLR